METMNVFFVTRAYPHHSCYAVHETTSCIVGIFDNEERAMNFAQEEIALCAKSAHEAYQYLLEHPEARAMSASEKIRNGEFSDYTEPSEICDGQFVGYEIHEIGNTREYVKVYVTQVPRPITVEL